MRLLTIATMLVGVTITATTARAEEDYRYPWTSDVRTWVGQEFKQSTKVKARHVHKHQRNQKVRKAVHKERKVAERHHRARHTHQHYDAPAPAPVAHGGLIDEARRYMGGNPTGWRSLWCGKFMELVVRRVGGTVPKGPNLARNWASLPRTSPRVGAIAVLARGHGGHVGIVSGFDRRGNPIIVSGNHGHRVGEGVYSSRRVIAYVSAI